MNESYQEQINQLRNEIRKNNIPDNPVKIIDNSKLITYKQRFIWIASAFTISLLITVVFYNLQSEFFSILSGITALLTGLIFALAADYKLTNGDSFDKISESGIALSISFFAFILLFLGGLFFGEKYSPERFSNEAVQRIEKQIDYLQQSINSNKNSDTLKKNDNENWNEGNTR